MAEDDKVITFAELYKNTRDQRHLVQNTQNLLQNDNCICQIIQ